MRQRNNCERQSPSFVILRDGSCQYNQLYSKCYRENDNNEFKKTLTRNPIWAKLVRHWGFFSSF